jgi:isopentenyl phosphate kinase
VVGAESPIDVGGDELVQVLAVKSGPSKVQPRAQVAGILAHEGEVLHSLDGVTAISALLAEHGIPVHKLVVSWRVVDASLTIRLNH